MLYSIDSEDNLEIFSFSFISVPVTSKNNSACWREEWEVWLRSVWDLWMIFKSNINLKCEKKTSSNVLDTHELMPMSLLQPCKASKSKWMAIWAPWLKKPSSRRQGKLVSREYMKRDTNLKIKASWNPKTPVCQLFCCVTYVLRSHQSWRRISHRASATSCWYVHYETSKVGYFPVPVFAALFLSSWLKLHGWKSPFVFVLHSRVT